MGLLDRGHAMLGSLQLLSWIELQIRFEEVSYAVLTIDMDTEEHTAYATMDLLTLITEEMNRRIQCHFGDNWQGDG